MNLEAEVEAIKDRNRRVEADKAWETSGVRRVFIALLTYALIVLFFLTAGFPRPFLSALVPATGFVLSTLSLSLVKRYWIRRFLRGHARI
ncbi:MAG: hypothetical protein KGI41_03205 [Patescibacteria group bacterium]|nr:hypothetical protein [Patescibacteria group bacterium]